MRHWLIQIRKAKGFTQKEAATLAKISRSYLGDIEQGRRAPGGKAAKRIGDVLGFDMTLFFVDGGRKTSHLSAEKQTA